MPCLVLVPAPPNISVDLVNFTDNSLIPISGYVSYEDTPCFIEGAEITVDELSLIPPLKTSEDGKFTIELEPGTVGSVMRAVYGNDTFVPTFIELPMLSRPISGQYFQSKNKSDRLTESIIGQLEIVDWKIDHKEFESEDLKWRN